MRATAVLTAILMLCTTGWALADVTVTLDNQSSRSIHQLYLSPPTEDDWGPDQLGEDFVKSGESIDLTGVPPGIYDVLLVDKDGNECTVEHVGIAGTKDRFIWLITDYMLAFCMVPGQ